MFIFDLWQQVQSIFGQKNHDTFMTMINPMTGYSYNLSFIVDHPQAPYIQISTEIRDIFLQQGTEQEAQEALVALAHQVRRRSGGVFDLHPFYGAVWGTKLTPVAHDFLVDMPELDRNLSMIIYLSNERSQFDTELTKTALELGTVITFPGPNTAKYIAYQKAAIGNPNQKSRDQAIVNGLDNRWDEEFRRFHTEPHIPSAIILSPKNIRKLMRSLEKEGVVTDLFSTN